DEETPVRVNRFKTAAYTVERPLHIGAALAGAPADTVSALREFGVAVGQAFQLRDDLLGVYGDPDVTGKPSGDDLREGKRTLLLARGVRSAPPEDAEYLLSVLGTDVDDDALDRARRILTDSGAVASVESEIDALTDRALAAIDSGSVSVHGRETLRALAGAATRRQAWAVPPHPATVSATGTASSSSPGAVREVTTSARRALSGPSGPALWRGTLGAALLTVGGFGAGSLPVDGGPAAAVGLPGFTFGHGQVLALVLCWTGIALLVTSWLALGPRAVRGLLPARDAVWATALWSVPLLPSVPLFSTDAWT